MKVRWFLAVLIFYFLQTSVSGSFKCPSRRWSYHKGHVIPLVYIPSQIGECDDTCIQFKCIIEDDVIIQGSGCYLKFESFCRYVPTQLKETIKKNMSAFKHVDSSLIVASNNSYWGGPNEYTKLIELKPEAETNFAAHLKTKWDGKSIVQMNDKFSKPRDNKESVQCAIKQACKSGSKFDEVDILHLNKTKSCDACVSFMCTVDGQKIMYGNGCYEDFDKACGNVAAADKQVIKGSIKNSFHYGKNFVAVSCSHEDKCSDLELKRYTYINKDAYETFTRNVDKSFVQGCDYQPLTIQDQLNALAPASPSSLASFNIKLFGMLIFGFAFIYLL